MVKVVVKTESLPRGIRKRGKKYFFDVSHADIRKTGTCETLEEAIAGRAKALAELTAPIPVNGAVSDWTLQRAYDLTVATRWSASNAIVTATHNANVCLDFFGKETRLDKIDETAIDDFRMYLRAIGYTNSTINRKTSALSVMLNVAYRRRGLSRMPHIGRLPELNVL